MWEEKSPETLDGLFENTESSLVIPPNVDSVTTSAACFLKLNCVKM